ncbi:hypothetical protein PHMEG_00010963 [Phytophthora megakarya]|uniref:Myb-like domain-containing protein n=1 Tax=Phytophthora megakarya TaxID=4795 RepID=A0A225WEV9_9STRA|nr:hypothetical protein PHMEG_00010963 [Phytophthora megakarya]
MSDFTDDEDRQLVVLVDTFTANNMQINWNHIAQSMKRTKKTKETLRQRLKTLKKTHGPGLEHFRQRYFRKQNSARINHQQQQASRRMSVSIRSVHNQGVRSKVKLQPLKSSTKLNRHEVHVSRQVSMKRQKRGGVHIQTNDKLQSNRLQTMAAKLHKSPTTSLCSQKGVPPLKKIGQPDPLLLLASVACTGSRRFDA